MFNFFLLCLTSFCYYKRLIHTHYGDIHNNLKLTLIFLIKKSQISFSPLLSHFVAIFYSKISTHQYTYHTTPNNPRFSFTLTLIHKYIVEKTFNKTLHTTCYTRVKHPLFTMISLHHHSILPHTVNTHKTITFINLSDRISTQ